MTLLYVTMSGAGTSQVPLSICRRSSNASSTQPARMRAWITMFKLLVCGPQLCNHGNPPRRRQSSTAWLVGASLRLRPSSIWQNFTMHHLAGWHANVSSTSAWCSSAARFELPTARTIFATAVKSPLWKLCRSFWSQGGFSPSPTCSASSAVSSTSGGGAALATLSLRGSRDTTAPLPGAARPKGRANTQRQHLRRAASRRRKRQGANALTPRTKRELAAAAAATERADRTTRADVEGLSTLRCRGGLREGAGV
mmetsp:Transcript_70245/g.195525  ORF Transcript_70245/g.195525 Transcript_70245/m.195525 type:complete len:254 (-) Transcript_70245:498-1259(-)